MIFDIINIDGNPCIVYMQEMYYEHQENLCIT